MPRFVIVMPCFNNEATVLEAINSALASTYRDFALVITDNGSRDRSAEIIDAVKDDRLVKHLHSEPIAKTLNWNRAYRDVPDCEYLVTLHADDLLAPEGLDHIARLAGSRPALIHGRHATITEGGSPIPRSGFPLDYCASGAEFRRLLMLGNIVSVPGASIRADLFEAVGGWRDEWFMQDLEMWWLLSTHGDVHYSGKILGTYRLLDDPKHLLYVREYARWYLAKIDQCDAAARANGLLNLAAHQRYVHAVKGEGVAVLAETGVPAMTLPKLKPWNEPLSRQRLARLKLAVRSAIFGCGHTEDKDRR